MTEEEKKIQQLLKIGRIGLNVSILAIVSIVVVFMVSSFPVKIKEPQEEKLVAEEPMMMDDFTSPDIKNGIHEPSGLVADTGFTMVLSTCTQCHAIEVVKQNRATKQGWKKMITWMQKTQGLWDLGENEELILNYLAKNYAPVNTGRRKNLENIVWYRLK